MTHIDDNDLLQQFASDNYAGICPEAWSSTEEANRGHVSAYGNDPWTFRASDAFRELFETDCEVFFAVNGTAANSLALASLCQSYHGVICGDSAHVETDECGAPSSSRMDPSCWPLKVSVATLLHLPFTRLRLSVRISTTPRYHHLQLALHLTF